MAETPVLSGLRGEGPGIIFADVITLRIWGAAQVVLVLTVITRLFIGKWGSRRDDWTDREKGKRTERQMVEGGKRRERGRGKDASLQALELLRDQEPSDVCSP